MGRLLRGAALVVLGWFGAIVGRRMLAEQARVGSAGIPVELPTMTDVLAVHDTLWRGPAPSTAGYGELGQAGVHRIVDLRSEATADAAQLAAAAALDLVIVPIDNGRYPTPADLVAFADVVAADQGVTYVHCEAGEGRTGAIVGALKVRHGAPVVSTVTEQLSVGSLTIAQMAFVAFGGRWPAAVTAIDYAIDRPTERIFDLAR